LRRVGASAKIAKKKKKKEKLLGLAVDPGSTKPKANSVTTEF
jgi:hypothetical protein